MDLVGYSESKFNEIKHDYLDFVKTLNLTDIHFIPMSALDGDNVVNASSNMPWFTGCPMMELLNTIEIASDHNFTDARFPVQYVNRPNLDFRGFCGTVASGVFRINDQITALPSGSTSTIKSICTFDTDLDFTFPGQAVTLTLKGEIDISRGDIIVGTSEQTPTIADKFKATIVWMTEQAMTPGRQYIIKLATRSVSGSISMIHHRIDVNTLEHHDANELKLNEIGLCTVTVNAPVVFDPYKNNKTTGSFIIIDRLSNVTVGAGMIFGDANNDDWQPVSAKERATRFGQTASIIQIYGTNAKDIATYLERKLFDTGHAATVLDCDEDGRVAKAIANAGLLCITLATSHYVDVSFNCNDYSADEIYSALKNRSIIF